MFKNRAKGLGAALLVVAVGAANATASWAEMPDSGWQKYTSSGLIICSTGIWTCRLVQDF